MHSLTVYLTAVLALGVAGQWLAWRLKLPSILILLTLGFVTGRFAPPELYLGDRILLPIVSLSVALILFEGGLSLRIRELENARALLGLVTVGIFVTFVLTTAAAVLLFDLSWGVGAVAGAILVVSGPTVIIPLLAFVRPVRRVESLVKWEGIVNDPIGAVLAVLVFEAVVAGGFRHAALETLVSVALTVLVGGLLGGLSSLLIVWLLRHHLLPDSLEIPVLFAAVLSAFTLSNELQSESGLVTVTVFGILLANQKSVVVHHLIEFKENLRTLLASVLFILLGSRIEIERITSLGLRGLLFLALLIVVIRPVSVFLGTLGTALSWQSRTFLACMHPRGIVAAAVSSVFALEMLRMIEAGELTTISVEEARRLVPIVFLVIVGSVAIYGLAATPIARLLGLADANPQGILFAGAEPIVQAIAAALKDEGIEVLLVDTNHRNVAQARVERGLRTASGSILADYFHETTEFGGIGRLMAMTSNDEVNSLASLRYAETFGRAGVFQLPPGKQDSARTEAVPQRLRGRYLFRLDATHRMLTAAMESGWIVKTAALTQEYDFERFLERYPQALLLMVLDKSGGLAIATTEKPLKPVPGQKVVCLIHPAPAVAAPRLESAPAPAETEPAPESP